MFRPRIGASVPGFIDHLFQILNWVIQLLILVDVNRMVSQMFPIRHISWFNAVLVITLILCTLCYSFVQWKTCIDVLSFWKGQFWPSMILLIAKKNNYLEFPDTFRNCVCNLENKEKFVHCSQTCVNCNQHIVSCWICSSNLSLSQTNRMKTYLDHLNSIFFIKKIPVIHWSR